MMKHLFSWVAYAAFVCTAFVLSWHDQLFVFDGVVGLGKAVLWVVWLGFFAFSVYCSRKENFFRTLGTMKRLYWGRQIGLDLYIYVGLFLVLIYLHSGSLIVLGLWLLPVLLFANLATLVYLLIHYEAIVNALAVGLAG